MKYRVTTLRGWISNYASRRFLSASSKIGLIDYSLFVLKSWVGANRNRRIVAHHGSSSQTLFWRTAKYASRRFQSASRKTGLALYSMHTQKMVGGNGNRRISAHHGSSSPHLPKGSAGMRFKLSNGYVVFFYVFAVRFDKLYWPAASHKLMAKRAGVFFYDLQSPLA